ncbi:tRNA methyltransferase complex GCD14 subunit-domain-containing protein [Naematelia encephala]|uniref:tRNA (adenine(58)-N(1))-methyltransferase catalytic subunit TRM61 n=1 Tax=Naematelia encephala TaxID=71784 RepID=A0A1Y2ASR1_9TREE|nr:tRNA methyltransferase complex GCD14 subunit-domain-containing protein [Naematelia encephala]
MFHSRIHIDYGDLVILYFSSQTQEPVIITSGGVFHNKYGRYPHDELVGQKYGSKIHSPAPNPGFVFALRPTPELWTLSLPHRTQILYMPDIAYITMRLGVRVGGSVIEAGTGSGSMTHALSRSVGKRGRVQSYEYHRVRWEKAKVEFEEHGLDNVILQHRNVCKDGFGDDVSGVEAVFLDLPAPWEAIPHAVKTLRPDMITKICCFSPCLEQVLKTVSTLRSEGFMDISTEEVLIRKYELVQPLPPSSNAFKTIDEIVKDLQDHEVRKESRRVIQMRTARQKVALAKQTEALSSTSAAPGDMSSVDITVPTEMTETGAKRSAEADDGEGQHESKRPKLDDPLTTTNESIGLSPVPPPAVLETTDGAPQQTKRSRREPVDPINTITYPKPPRHEITENLPTSTILTRPYPEMRGHTSYLTFASYYPASIRDLIVEPRPQAQRVGELLEEDKARPREQSQETEYGDVLVEETLGKMSEEDLWKLQST